MPPKGGNAKKESGRAKKAENEAIKRTAAAEAEVRSQAGLCNAFTFMSSLSSSL
jgi:hypothetical protein